MRTRVDRTLIHELLRVALLLGLTGWLSAPLFTRSLIGGGDAVWYHHQIGDAVTQFRSGVFPVFVGQTHYAFNGAVHPIRTAPYCQYFAGLIDLVTGRSLGFHTLLHLTATLSLVGGALTAYAALVWLAPQQRWRAAVLAWAYVAAPGVAGLPFAQDLYMSAMTIPWVPVAFAALVQTFRTGGKIAPLVLGAAMGALWWAHSPIALWSTLIIGIVLAGQGIGEWRRGRIRQWLRVAALAGFALGTLGSYPFVSVFFLREPGERIVPRLLDREELLREISTAFPAIVQPLDLGRPLLTFIQPGYPVLLGLLAAGVAVWSAPAERRRTIAGLVTGAAVYLLLILPVPGITVSVWRHLPEMWVSMTNIWPMQRLCIIVAAIAVVAAQAVLPALSVAAPQIRRINHAALAFVVLWSVWEAEKLRALARQRTRPEAEMVRLAAEENVNVSEYCYQQLPRRPAYFIHGVADPRMEVRLLDAQTGGIIRSNKQVVETAATGEWLPLERARVSATGAHVLRPELTLEPGERYLLTFHFTREDVHGLLRLVGSTMDRVYVMPSAGEAKGFGTGASQEKSITVWTDQVEPEMVRFEFIPDQAVGKGSTMRALGQVRLTAIVPARLPVEVLELVPLAMTVRTTEPAWVETMRMSVPGWTATVNGNKVPVQRSSEGLVAVEVPPGESQVALTYTGPLLLRVAFWTNLTGWLMAAIAGAALALRRLGSGRGATA
jgi:hypothetical protein